MTVEIDKCLSVGIIKSLPVEILQMTKSMSMEVSLIGVPLKLLVIIHTISNDRLITKTSHRD